MTVPELRQSCRAVTETCLPLSPSQLRLLHMLFTLRGSQATREKRFSVTPPPGNERSWAYRSSVTPKHSALENCWPQSHISASETDEDWSPRSALLMNWEKAWDSTSKVSFSYVFLSARTVKSDTREFGYYVDYCMTYIILSRTYSYMLFMLILFSTAGDLSQGLEHGRLHPHRATSPAPLGPSVIVDNSKHWAKGRKPFLFFL